MPLSASSNTVVTGRQGQRTRVFATCLIIFPIVATGMLASGAGGAVPNEGGGGGEGEKTVVGLERSDAPHTHHLRRAPPKALLNEIVNRPMRPVTPYGVIVEDAEHSHLRGTKRPSWIWEFYGSGVNDADDPLVRASKVYCSGDLLAAVQMSGIFEDSKEFVDMPMKVDPEEILRAFDSLSAVDRMDPAVLRGFVTQYFDPAGTDLTLHDPEDFTLHPSVLDLLPANSSYYPWVQALNSGWKLLVRKVANDVYVHPQRYSMLRRKQPFVIPGGRFREGYYWDSYWIVLGLLACDMKDTARGMVSNLLDDVSTYGFVPNGARVYYLNRSQPPFLSDMVLAIIEQDSVARQDTPFITKALAVLEREYTYWMAQGRHAVTITTMTSKGRQHVMDNEDDVNHHHHHQGDDLDDGDGSFTLNRYYTTATYPRPESYKEDVTTTTTTGMQAELQQREAAAETGRREGGLHHPHPHHHHHHQVRGLSSGEGQQQQEQEEQQLYADIAAGAESGWDFSSRWIVESKGGEYDLSSIVTTRVVPVELNAYLYRVERNIARLAELHATGVLIPAASSFRHENWTSSRAMCYHQASLRRAEAMDTFMWSEADAYWRDIDLHSPTAAAPTTSDVNNSSSSSSSSSSNGYTTTTTTTNSSHDNRVSGRDASPSSSSSSSSPSSSSSSPPGLGVTSISSFLPLWSGILHSPATKNGKDKEARVIQSLRDSGLLQVGGIQTTSKETDEQWDSPNAWSPMQHMIIQGLGWTDSEEGHDLALILAREWLAANHLGWVNTGQMFEKYNAKVPGARGEGGEYYPQVGFGWTNGVVLDLIKMYADKL